MSLLDVLQEKLSGKNVRIVLPEGEDERVLAAAVELQATDYVTPVLLGNEANVKALAADKGFDIAQIELIDPATSDLKQDNTSNRTCLLNNISTSLNKHIVKYRYQRSC